MIPSKAAAKLIAERLNCLLECDYDKVNGFTLLLWAPYGKAFAGIGACCSADLHGQGCLLKEIDWAKVIADIQRTAAEGYVDAENDESAEDE